jgi:hypothetical protein
VVGVRRTSLVLHVGVSDGSSQRCQPSQSHEVVRGAHEIAGEVDAFQATQSCSAQTTHCFAPARWLEFRQREQYYDAESALPESDEKAVAS